MPKIFIGLLSCFLLIFFTLFFVKHREGKERTKRLSERENHLSSLVELEEKQLEELKEEFADLRVKVSVVNIKQSQEAERQRNALIQELEDFSNLCEERKQQLNYKITLRQQDYEALIKPLQLLQKEKEAKFFHCIIPREEAQEDIDFLMKEVAPRMRNRSIIPKLIWSEYYQLPTQEMMKRIEMEDVPGIYKITNLNNGKCYIGQATKIKSRCIDHVKGAIGITTISDQKIHKVMREEGIGNFTFEKICTCTKEELNEKEKFYIKFFKANEYGYNLTKGG